MTVAVRRWPRLRKLEQKEITWLLIGLGACVLLWVFATLASEVLEGETTAFDVWILTSLRSASDPSTPVGPQWLASAMLDFTSLGSPAVLGLFIAAVTGFLLLQGRYHTAIVVLMTSLSGELVNITMKNFFLRPRPSVVPHLRDVISSSFPSGHAMQSAIIYLTLGAMLMRIAERRLTKMYILGVAVVLTVLVGVSRVFIGVHYPTDVIGGWIFGFVWASICWLVAQRFEPVIGVKEERAKAAAS